jgi:hypothetical protein
MMVWRHLTRSGTPMVALSACAPRISSSFIFCPAWLAAHRVRVSSSRNEQLRGKYLFKRLPQITIGRTQVPITPRLFGASLCPTLALTQARDLALAVGGEGNGHLRAQLHFFCPLLGPAETARVGFGEGLQKRRRKTSKVMETGHSTEANKQNEQKSKRPGDLRVPLLHKTNFDPTSRGGGGLECTPSA